MAKKLEITFYGGVGKVTGANFMLRGEKTNILVDCGLIQGSKICEEENRNSFAYDPKSANFLFITHSHIDHVGRIPKLVKDGFNGVIYSTPETKALAYLMLEDSLGVLGKEAVKENLPPIYSMEDVVASMALWKEIPYHEKTKISDDFEVYFRDAGHILGSAMIEFTYIPSGGEKRKITFTGDLGNSPTPLLNDTEIVNDTDYLVMESVYGDRNHEGIEERRNQLIGAINKIAHQGGVMLIPAFSLEKTQVVLHEINSFIMENKIPKIDFYLDSPLAIKVTDVYQKMSKNFNLAVRNEIKGGDDVFNFPNLKNTLTTEESQYIKKEPNPKVIIAGSGMSNGGRIVRHEKIYLSDPNNIILLIGYQAAGSLGREIQDGAKYVNIGGDTIPVRAEVINITGYSSHKDSDDLVSFVEPLSGRVKKVFVVMGEPKSALFLVQKIRDNLDIDAYHPEQDETVVLD